MDDDLTAPAIKMGIAGAGVTLSGLTLNEWVALATLVYVIAQIGLLLPKYWVLIAKRRRR